MIENYWKARDIIAEELIEKFHLNEVERDDEILTLESSKYKIILLFFTQDGDDVFIKRKDNTEPTIGTPFRYFIFDLYPHSHERTEAFKAIYKPLNGIKLIDYDVEAMLCKFRIKIKFLAKHFPSFFH